MMNVKEDINLWEVNMEKNNIIKHLLKQFVYIDNNNNECIDYCESCDRMIIQTNNHGRFCCEYCQSEKIIILKVEE